MDSLPQDPVARERGDTYVIESNYSAIAGGRLLEKWLLATTKSARLNGFTLIV